MKKHIYLLFVSLFLALITVQASQPALTVLTDWHVDAINGDDENGIGSAKKPFKSLHTLLAVNDVFPGFVGPDDTIHLAAGEYNTEPVEIDIPNIRIEGSLNEYGQPASILGDVTITAGSVTLTNCQFLDGELTLLGVKAVTITNCLFSGTTKNSLSLLGASGNTISNNYFESATESCVVIQFDSKSKQPSNDNIFEHNYFTHHPEKSTDQIIFSNKSSFTKRSSNKKFVSTGNRFLKCAFEETVSGSLQHVIVDESSWKTVEDRGPSLIFEDCYFKTGSRGVPFISFLILRKGSKPKWSWDELLNDTWITSNDGDLLTGNEENDYTPSIQFSDGDVNQLILETEYPFDLEWLGKMKLAKRENHSPELVNIIEDVAVYKNAEPLKINLFEVFEDDRTADKNLTFSVICDNTSLVDTQLENGLLTLNYGKDEVGMALIKVTANDNDSVDSKSTTSEFYVFIVEETDTLISKRSDWYVDCRKGNDSKGTGDPGNPFKTVERALAAYTEQSDFEDICGTIHLGAGLYGSDGLKINIPGLSLEGTLDKNGKPATILGETMITADGVKLTNCKFSNVGLILFNTKNVLISNNLFVGTTHISLKLLGASNNTIQHNEFSSAIHDCVHIYWDAESGQSSNDNLFFRNYFTHRAKDVTKRVIRVYWVPGANNSINARNHFVECAFEETNPHSLLRVVDDENTWWVVADYKYSIMFEDCYFKRADREKPFSEFVILKGHPDYIWRWDELVKDEWVSTNGQCAITGDHNGWNHRPRIQFVDKDENGNALEPSHNAGLLPADKSGD